MASSRDNNSMSKNETTCNNCSIDIQRMHMWNSYNYEYPCCCFCMGFYGPCFGEPVCFTCHLFLFPDDINSSDCVQVFGEKTDDDDSGNEEPTDFDFDARRCEQRPVCPPSKPDKLTEIIKTLSVTKENVGMVSPEVVEHLPTEVLLIIFSYLDDISLWRCGQVCRRWQHLISTETTQEQWKQFCCKRWPLYNPRCKIQAWKSLYTRLIHGTPCLLCLYQMTIQVNLPAEENSWRSVRLKNELKALRSDPPEGIEAAPLDLHCCHWQACISGPVGSPYEGGLFFLYLQIPHSYPMIPPVVRFITKIFHPNISRHGDVGIDSIHHNWSLALTISKLLISIQSLLTDPFCLVCMEPQVGRLYIEDRPTFEKVARLWTRRYAIHENILFSVDFCKSLESG